MSTEYSSCFYGNYLKKKVHKNEWKDFWVVLKGKWLFFLKEKGAESACGVLELSERSTCIMLVPSGKNRTSTKVDDEQGSGGCKGFKFKIRSKRGFHLFKTHSLGACQGWIRSISDSVKVLQDPSYVKMASEVLTNRSDAVNSSQEPSGDGYRRSTNDADKSRRTSDKKTSRHLLSFRGDASIRGLRRSFRSLRVLKSEFSGNAYGELK